ncbi:MAG: YtxH domain-containing protein [Hymenobacter sp.]|nr:MAG: YtxH domain-containing protein [Hymenobacter sp.]
MPVKDNTGKIIVSLLAGATAGVVAGLLLAPETGDETRKTLAQGASKIWSGNLGQLLKGAAARLNIPVPAATATPASTDQQAADALLHGMSSPEPGDLATPAGAGNGHSLEGDREDDANVLRS